MHSPLYIGPLTDETFAVLKTAWKWGGVAIQSNFARANAKELALCASQGWLSTVDPDGKAYRDRWRITQAGLMVLEHKENMK